MGPRTTVDVDVVVAVVVAGVILASKSKHLIAVAVAVDLAVAAAVVDFAVDAAAVVVAVAVVLRPSLFFPADRLALKHFRRRRDKLTAPSRLPVLGVDAESRHPESAQQGR